MKRLIWLILFGCFFIANAQVKGGAEYLKNSKSYYDRDQSGADPSKPLPKGHTLYCEEYKAYYPQVVKCPKPWVHIPSNLFENVQQKAKP